ncbi:MAG: hypothetical protein RLO52_33210 [Sandaracinaceae bacterium]
MLSPPSDAQALVDRARQLFARTQDQAADVVSAARSRCDRWELATDEYFSFDPLDVELRAHAGASRGKPLTSEPTRGGFYRFGFDADGELIVTERVSRFALVECLFPECDDSVAVEIAPNGRHRLRSVRVRESGPSFHWVVAFGGREDWSVRRYDLDATGHAVRVVESTPLATVGAEVEYDALGRPIAIVDQPSAAVRWSRPTAGLRELLAWYENALVDALEAPIAHAVRDHDAVVVALAYGGGGGDTLPPELAVATHDMIAAAPPEMALDPHNMIGDRHGDDVPELRIDAPRLAEVGSQITFELGSNAAELRRLLRRVAKALSAREWAGGKRIVVYAADLDAANWGADLRAVVGSTRLRALGIGRR